MLIRRYLFFFFILNILLCEKSSQILENNNFINLAIDKLYNYDFDSTSYYLDLAYIDNKNHPLIPFLNTTNSWLSTQSDLGFESSYLNIRNSIKENIPIYKKLINEFPDNAEYFLYLGSLYGLEARIELARSNWLKAFFSTRKGNNYIVRAYELNPELTDIYLPLGLISYYTCISNPFIKFVAKISGIKFECDKSIEYLEIASQKSSFAYIESSNLLSYIYLYMDKNYDKALTKISPLVDKFPNHPFFPFIEAECLIKLGRYDDFNKKVKNLNRFLKVESNIVADECQAKLNYLFGLKLYYDNKYNESIIYFDKVINNYNLEFNWLLGLSYYYKSLNNLKNKDLDSAKSDLKSVIAIDFKFPEKDLAYKLLEDLNDVK